MIIPFNEDADLLTVLSRLSSCYVKLAARSSPLLTVPLTLSSIGIALSSALGDSCE